MLGLRANRAHYKRMELNLPLKKSICLTQAFRLHFLLKDDWKKLKVEKEGSDVYEQNEPQIEKADQGELQLQLLIGVLRWEKNCYPLAIVFFIGFIVTHVSILTSDISRSCHQKPSPIDRTVGKAKWGHPRPLSALPRAIDIIRSRIGSQKVKALSSAPLTDCSHRISASIRSRSSLLTRSRLISLPLATQMFQFAKFEKSKERRLATELGYSFPIGDPWITDGISLWPFASESVLPSQCPSIHPMHSFCSCTHGVSPLPPPKREKQANPRKRPALIALKVSLRLPFRKRNEQELHSSVNVILCPVSIRLDQKPALSPLDECQLLPVYGGDSTLVEGSNQQYRGSTATGATKTIIERYQDSTQTRAAVLSEVRPSNNYANCSNLNRFLLGINRFTLSGLGLLEILNRSFFSGEE
nr:putative mitochondrial protein [Tanacetum cinerariifolium]